MGVQALHLGGRDLAVQGAARQLVGPGPDIVRQDAAAQGGGRSSDTSLTPPGAGASWEPFGKSVFKVCGSLSLFSGFLLAFLDQGLQPVAQRSGMYFYLIL